jgi:ribosomal protein S18 acetylase RimI-like enzyme
MLVFRKAKPSDILLLNILAREIWTTCYPDIITMEQIEYMLELMYSLETIEKEMANGVIWKILEYDSRPVGYLAITCSEDEVKLNKLYLKADYHGKGLGQNALQYIIKYAKQNKYKKVSLTVNKGNLNAIKAYEKAGFTRTDSIVSDIGGGYVMDDFIYSYLIT